MKLCNNLPIDSLNDLVKLKILEEVGTTKINKSKVARDLGIDRRTVSKYMNGYVKKVNRERKSSIDEYYDVIKDLLDDRSSQVFFYKRVLWQYLKDNHGLKCAQSSFRRWISKHEEFQSYFNGSRNRMINGQKRNSSSSVHVIHYETEAGYEAQLDWKESMSFLLNTGEYVDINIIVL